MGYDGYGVNKISNNKDLEKIDDCPCIVEELISIIKELSVMVASRKSGELINYPVVEMEFNSDSNQVEYILSPAKINFEIKSNAEQLAIAVAKKLKIVGILAVEMFLNKTISFDKIIDIIDYSLFKINLKSPTCVEDTLEIDKITRLEVLSYVKCL